jgi:hypothetical protein
MFQTTRRLLTLHPHIRKKNKMISPNYRGINIMKMVQEAFVRVIKGRVENKLPDNISEIQNDFIQEYG